MYAKGIMIGNISGVRTEYKKAQHFSNEISFLFRVGAEYRVSAVLLQCSSGALIQGRFCFTCRSSR